MGPCLCWRSIDTYLKGSSGENRYLEPLYPDPGRILYRVLKSPDCKFVRNNLDIESICGIEPMSWKSPGK